MTENLGFLIPFSKIQLGYTKTGRYEAKSKKKFHFSCLKIKSTRLPKFKPQNFS